MPVVLILSPLKLDTPLTAGTEVVPLAKLPEERATETVSLEPVPEETTLLNWSSRVAPTLTVPPAVIDAGCELMTNWVGVVGFTVRLLVAPALTPVLVVSEAVIV